MYQFGYEQCDPGHSFGPATRNHYLFHYILSGTGTLMADNAKGETQTYSVKSGQGFMIFPGQINTYIADEQLPWEYMWIEFDGLRVKEALSVTDLCKDAPVYHSHSKELREKLADEMLYIVNHPQESSFHLIGHTDRFQACWRHQHGYGRHHLLHHREGGSGREVAHQQVAPPRHITPRKHAPQRAEGRTD